MSWSQDHLDAIARIEEAVHYGALYAFALARGTGKTTLCRMAILWAAANALRSYCYLIGANEQKAQESLDAIKSWIQVLTDFGEDYPEISYAAKAIGRTAHRAGGQLCNGESTWIEWNKNSIVLPRVPVPKYWPKRWPTQDGGYAPTSGCVIGVSGLTGAGIRGSLFPHPSGRQIRPDIVMIDDPQTDESAGSDTQNATREQLISGAVLGMAGPGKAISAVMPCTCIKPGDMVDRLLDRERHPLWRGDRRGVLRSMPVNMQEWAKYFEVYRGCMQLEPPDLTEANAYYDEHREILDAGAVAAWEERKRPNELSAIQHAMHWYCRDPHAFWAEGMNRPEADLQDSRPIVPADVVRKVSVRKQGDIPAQAQYLTAMIDVHDRILFWTVCAWTPEFAGWVVDYGGYPDQRRMYFSTRDIHSDLQKEAGPGANREAGILAGLVTLGSSLLQRSWAREDGVSLELGSLNIDCGWVPETVKEAILVLRHEHSGATIYPHRGRGVKASDRPISEYSYQPGDRRGHFWRLYRPAKGGQLIMESDVNYWKSHVRDGFAAPAGAPGCIQLFSGHPARHQCFADHLGAESPKLVYYPREDRKKEEWEQRPNKPDNHWLDCMVGCASGASYLGAVLPGATTAVKRGRKKVDLSAIAGRR